jgi:hypothetical protein
MFPPSLESSHKMVSSGINSDDKQPEYLKSTAMSLLNVERSAKARASTREFGDIVEVNHYFLTQDQSRNSLMAASHEIRVQIDMDADTLPENISKIHSSD